MKKLLTVTALVALAASPAFAASKYRHAVRANAATSAYAAAPGYAYTGSNPVVVDGNVVGADPDPNVRLQLLKDAYTKDQ